MPVRLCRAVILAVFSGMLARPVWAIPERPRPARTQTGRVVAAHPPARRVLTRPVPSRPVAPGPRLNAIDTAMLNATVAQLNAARPVRVGDQSGWSNGESGNSGVVQVVGVTAVRGRACHALRYDLTLRGAGAQSRTVTWCKAGASWRAAS